MGYGGELLNIEPLELAFSFEVMKQSSCAIQLTNKTNNYVAFKIKTTNPKQYSVRPNMGVILPHENCDVTVTMQAQKEAPPDMQCKDKFLVQSVTAVDGATAADVTNEMFTKESGAKIEDCKLRVVYLPVQKELEDGCASWSSSLENGSAKQAVLSNGAPNTFSDSLKEKPSEASSTIARLTEEKLAAIQENRRLRRELELLRRGNSNPQGGFSFKFVVLIALLSILIGYLVRKA